jgi:hypothetical protein
VKRRKLNSFILIKMLIQKQIVEFSVMYLESTLVYLLIEEIFDKSNLFICKIWKLFFEVQKCLISGKTSKQSLILPQFKGADNSRFSKFRLVQLRHYVLSWGGWIIKQPNQINSELNWIRKWEKT